MQNDAKIDKTTQDQLELERYRKIFNVKGRGLTPEQENFWSDVSKLRFRTLENYEIIGVMFDNPIPGCQWLIVIAIKITTGSIEFMRFDPDGSYYGYLTPSKEDIILIEP